MLEQVIFLKAEVDREKEQEKPVTYVPKHYAK